jgi:hypothetical protein
VTRRDKVAQAVDRALLGTMMLCIAFVLEKALDRMVEAKPDEPRAPSRVGHGFIRRLIPGMSASIQHQHPHTPPGS